MENWTDKAIKRHVEDVIEETYLLSLTETEILDYLRSFVHSCETVLNNNLSIHGDVRLTKVKLTLLKAYLLLQENFSTTISRPNGEEKPVSRVEYLAPQVVQLKSAIIHLLDTMNPAVSHAVNEENRHRRESSFSTRENKKNRESFFIVAGYAILLCVSLAVLCVSILL